MSNINFFRVMQPSNFPPASIPCNSSGASFSGNIGIYYAQAIVLGTGIGPVTCSFESYNVPDRFRLKWEGNSNYPNSFTVADSLIVGDQLTNQSLYNNYTGSIGSVTSLTRYNYNFSTDVWITGTSEATTYTSASFPPYTGATGNYLRGNAESLNPNGRGNWGAQKGVNNDDPSSTSAGTDGTIQLCFYKHKTHPTSFEIIIDGPVSGTEWNLSSVNCPSGTTLNSSSIMDNAGSIALVYHTAPTFDLDVGMTVYKDSALTIPFATGPAWASGSYWGTPPALIVSGSLAIPSGTGAILDTCFKNELGDSTGYPFIQLADTGEIDSRMCSASAGRP